MKLIKICLPFAFLLFAVVVGSGQEKKETKIVVVEKVTDENGKVTTKKVEKSGKEAEDYLKEKKEELGLSLSDGQNSKRITKEVRVKVDSEQESSEKKIRIKVRDDGEEKVLEWDGEGEMPEEMKKYMEEENIDIDIDSDGEMKEVEVEIEEIENDIEIDEDNEIRVRVISGDSPRLGVVPENHVDGVQILEIMEGSAAEKAGLQEGDVIYRINDKYVGSVLQLKDRLKKAGVGEESVIQFLRDGKEQSVKIQL